MNPREIIAVGMVLAALALILIPGKQDCAAPHWRDLEAVEPGCVADWVSGMLECRYEGEGWTIVKRGY